MKKVYLSFVGFAFLCRLNSAAQTRKDLAANKPAFVISTPPVQDSSAYKNTALHVDQINLVSSYYSQNGDHSAITGGIGTQQVTDASNALSINLVWFGNGQNKNSILIGYGYDHHSSASSAYVTTTGLGKKDGNRIYPSIDWSIENPNKGTTFGVGTYYSGEYNYKSLGFNLNFSAKTHDRSGEFSFKAQAYIDHVTLIYPSEFIDQLSPPAPAGSTYITTASGNRVLSSGSGSSTSAPSLPTTPRNTYTASLAWSQIVNPSLQIAFLADVVSQNGLLSLPYHRVHFSDGQDAIEKLPSSRFKLPIGFRLNYFVGDNLILRSYYRYYYDNWDIHSSTANLELTYKFSPFFSISPFYRYYTQTAAKYFAPYGAHSSGDELYSSNYEFAALNSNFFGAGFRIAPPEGILGMRHLHELEIRYGHYSQTTNLISDVISLNLGFK
jgi:hypothetical protein